VASFSFKIIPVITLTLRETFWFQVVVIGNALTDVIWRGAALALGGEIWLETASVVGTSNKR
jgi:hypothetical protein